ncbi:MAG TPA: EamA family transporter RarD [Feifaniaceae bacterium]|nr:EamA family transporter RarD [Feifaniaceae bacterium]
MKDKKSLLMVLAGYVIWGVLPLYWHALSGIDPIVILCCRILMSAVCTTLLLLVTGRLNELWAVMRNKSLMKFLIPAAISVTVNWGVYIWAVSAGHVTDASLGYYMNPLVVFLFGTLIFKERCGKMELFALLLAAAGVLLSTLQYGAFPYIAITLAVSFALYGMFKKFAHVDGTVSIAVETIVLSPAALLFLGLSPQTQAAFQTATPLQFVFLLLAGIVTAAPLIMYTQGVNGLPFITMGFLQYVCPTLMLIVGVAVMGEPFTVAQGVSFAFIWAGLILFSVGMARREKKQAALEAAAEQD